jgi:hypothetical protein
MNTGHAGLWEPNDGVAVMLVELLCSVAIRGLIRSLSSHPRKMPLVRDAQRDEIGMIDPQLVRDLESRLLLPSRSRRTA